MGLTFTQDNLSTHLPIMEPNTAMEADSTAPYIAAYSNDSDQILIMYKPTENSHILQTKILNEFNLKKKIKAAKKCNTFH